MVYVSAHRCEAQHPKLKKRMKAAYTAWAERNKKYVISAKKRMNFREIRQKFLDYFKAHGHEIVASSSLIPLGSACFRHE